MRTVAAGVALLLATLVGCSSDEPAPVEVGPLASASGEPGATAAAGTDSGGASSTPSELLAPSTRASDPTAVQSATVAGASAFAREYVRLIQRGFAEADSAAVRKRTAPGCEGCEALIGAMDQAAIDGLRQRGGEYEVSSVATPPVNGGDVVLLLTYTRAASEVINSAGQVVQRTPAVPPTTVQMRLIYGDGGWLTQGYRIA